MVTANKPMHRRSIRSVRALAQTVLLIAPALGALGQGRVPIAKPDLATESIEVTICVFESRRHQVPLPSSLAFEICIRGADDARGPLFRGRTGSDGKAQLRLSPALGFKIGKNGLLALEARVTEDGYQQHRSQFRSRKGSSPKTYIAKLAGISGVTVRGQLVDGEGRGVRGSVRAYTAEQNQSAGSTNAREDGRFGVHLPPKFVGFLHASILDLGSGRTDVNAEAQTEELANCLITLRGAGVVRGRVTGEDGKPSACALIKLSALNDNMNRDPRRIGKAAYSSADLAGKGQTIAYPISDLEGRFEVRGLAEGVYQVQILRPEEFFHLAAPYQAPEAPIPPFVINADGKLRDFSIQRTHLVVRYIDAHGQPWDGSRSIDLLNPAKPIGGVPTDLVTLLLPKDPMTGRAASTRNRIPAYPLFGGYFVFELEPGREYWLGGVGDGYGGRLQTIAAAPGQDRQDVTIQALPLSRVGQIHLHGKELRPPGLSTDKFHIQAALEHVETGLRVQTKSIYPGRNSVAFETVEGPYKLILEEVLSPSCLLHVNVNRECRSTGKIVEVQAGKVLQVEMTL